MIKKLFFALFAKTEIHASIIDIKGQKSGGSRDSNKVDWYGKTVNGTVDIG
jgi:hypothetical protein